MFSAEGGGGNFFTQVGKTIRIELLCKKNVPLDGQNRHRGKIVLTAGQFAQCPALNKTPAPL